MVVVDIVRQHHLQLQFHLSSGPEGITAEASANVSTAGTITSIDVTNEGRNYYLMKN